MTAEIVGRGSGGDVLNSRRPLPLDGIRVVDLADGKVEMCGRILADLGAEVIKVEPPSGARGRRREPIHEGFSIPFAVHNANKLGVTLDLRHQVDRERLHVLIDRADILIETGRPGELDKLDLGVSRLRERQPALVVVSVTDYGQTGPYRDWTGTNETHIALAGELSRSGVPGRMPVLPPGQLADEGAAVQAAYAALLAYVHRVGTGLGDHVDCSIYELTAQVLDPGLGISGSARGGMNPEDLGRGRPDMRHLYPILPCADGFVRVAVLSTRQWRAMFEWLGRPAEFTDPKYDSFPARRAAHVRLGELMAELFADHTVAELTAHAQAVGIAMESLRSPADVLRINHFVECGALIDTEVAPDVVARVPSGYLEIDGRRAGIRHRAPTPGEHNAHVIGECATASAEKPAMRLLSGRPGRPLAGVRVLDLGSVVVGSETGRLLADQGAEVIKVESSAFIDGIRPQSRGVPMDQSFNAGNRNKRSIGLDLKSTEGAELFRQLVAKSDVVLSNFKPGTMDKLGFGIKTLRSINPAIIAVESSALGATGPFRHRLGYGPLVRASIGLTRLWQDPTEEEGFCDAITVYPDHVAARVGALGVLAALIRRGRTGEGGFVAVSQAETALTQLSTGLLRESLVPGSLRARGNTGEFNAPQGVYQAAGDDEWVVVWVEEDEQWNAMCRVIARDDLANDRRLATAGGRVAARSEVDAAVAAWLASVPPRTAMKVLQEAGVPAGFMQRITDYPEDPQLKARGFIREMAHPRLPGENIRIENAPATFTNIAVPALNPAPILGQDTRDVVNSVLGLHTDEIDRLIELGVLEEADSASTEELTRR